MAKESTNKNVKLHTLVSTTPIKKKRLGRGTGSGLGTTAGRGTKGQKARSGGGVRPRFEGGHTPLYRLLPKKRGGLGVRPQVATVNVDLLDKHFKAGAVVSHKSLVAASLIPGNASKIKVLGEGELKKKLVVYVDQASKQAIEKIEKAGGTVKINAKPAVVIKTKNAAVKPKTSKQK